ELRHRRRRPWRDAAGRPGGDAAAAARAAARLRRPTTNVAERPFAAAPSPRHLAELTVELEIVPASDAEYPIVRNLARFYICDMAVQAGWMFSADGHFDSGGRFACYWRGTAAPHAWPSAWRGFPFLLRVDGHPAGFALVKRVSAGPA